MVKNTLAPQKKPYGASMAQLAQKTLRRSRKLPSLKSYGASATGARFAMAHSCK
jgi:hypothetical protein